MSEAKYNFKVEPADDKNYRETEKLKVHFRISINKKETRIFEGVIPLVVKT